MTRVETLERAKAIVNGQRQTNYGTPERNFRLIADLWSAYLGVGIAPLDVANMMVLLKIARVSSGSATEDSLVDIAGYAACAAELIHGDEVNTPMSSVMGGRTE